MSAYLKRLIKTTELLNRCEDLWRQRPFVQLPVSWEASWPTLSTALRSLSPAEIDFFENHPAEIPSVQAAVPTLIAELAESARWPTLKNDADKTEYPAPKRISERKWAQVVSFAGAVRADSQEGVAHWMDWCAGKGHLGRFLNHTSKKPVTCVEKNPLLCEVGRIESKLEGADVRFVCRDVLDTHLEPVLDKATGAAALHACGYLNTGLITQCAVHRVPFIALAPCCYQRIDGMRYVPLSDEARIYNVPLSRQELRLPSLDATMTTENGRVLRRKEHAFRLGVDLLHRKETGIDRYLPLGAVKPAWLKQDFAHFANTVSAEKNIALPSRPDWRLAEAAGWDRYYQTSALGLARGLFRRVLESWLVLDRALFLESNSYDVRIGEFCPSTKTPRNLLIVAKRRK